MRVRTRYDTPNENGETKRARAERYGDAIDQPPPLIVPETGLYLWHWFWMISERLVRVRDGLCLPVPPSEFLAWCQLSDTIIHAHEYDILCAMDDAFCTETNAELLAYRNRQDEIRKQQIEAQRSRQRFRGKGR